MRRFYYTSTKAKYYGYHHCRNGSVPVALMDECIMKIVTPLFKDIKVLNGLINRVAPEKTAEIYKVMKKPEAILEKIPERDKLQLMRLLITNILVKYDTLEINWSDLALGILPDNYKEKTDGCRMVIDLPFTRRNGAMILSIPEDVVQDVSYNQELINALGKAFKYQKMLNQDKLTILQLAYQEKIDAGYLGRLIRLTCLAPDIVKRILNGTQPPTIYLQRLIREDIPPIWEDQRKLYKVRK